MDLFPRSEKIMFFVQWVLHPCMLRALIYKGFQQVHSFTLVINTTLSTWNELIESTSLSHFAHLSFMGTYPLISFCLLEHILEQPEICRSKLYKLLSHNISIVRLSAYIKSCLLIQMQRPSKRHP